MFRAVTAEQSRWLETSAVEQGASLAQLMRAAGLAVADEVAERVPEGLVIVLCGRGSNGGDGWVAARQLHAAGRDVRVLSLAHVDLLQGLAAGAAAEAIEAGVAWEVPSTPPTAANLAEASCVVDALLGTGSVLPLRDPLPAWCEVAVRSGAYVISVDVPTGVDSDTGATSQPAIVADATVTFGQPKLGLVTFPGAATAGEVVIADIGIPCDAVASLDAPELHTAEEYAALLPLPAPDAHKNSRGRVLVIAGSGLFTGAAVLAARGAMRIGAGYVTVAVPEPIVPVIQSHLVAAPVVGLPAGRTKAFSAAAAGPALELARDYDAVVLGPGLTLADGAVAFARRFVGGADRPIVIDADGLNALVDATEIITRRRAPTVLTPHPGELARLLAITAADVQNDRVSSSTRFSGEHTAVVLKGAGTVVSAAGRTGIVTAGTPALATAGTGDVLSGMVGALLAQGLDPYDAGLLGAYVHARAGESAASEFTPMCMTAEDLPEFIPAAIAELLEQW